VSNPFGAGTYDAGRLLLSGADVATVIAPLMADWNRSHIFNEQWPAHARFHGVVGLATPASLAALSVVRPWLNPHEAAARDFAAAIPVAYWGAFVPAALIKGTGVDDPPHPVGRVVGVPANLFYAILTTGLAIGGWLIDRRFR
jgi:hypothetical protein